MEAEKKDVAARERAQYAKKLKTDAVLKSRLCYHQKRLKCLKKM